MQKNQKIHSGNDLNSTKVNLKGVNEMTDQQKEVNVVETSNTIESKDQQHEANINHTETANETMPELPDGITEEPQHSEHIDLRGVANYPKWLPTYIKISDDAGEFIGDTTTEQEVRDLDHELEQTKLMEIENPEAMVSRIMEVLSRYTPLINKAENTTTGLLTKYRIRWGMLLNKLQVLVKKRLKLNWTTWFDRQFGKKLLRTAQDYMRIAEVPNSIRYAVFGKERIMQIIRTLGNTESQDPIGDFLRRQGINFDQSEVQENEDIRKQTDIAIAKSQLEANGLGHVPEDKVAAFIRSNYQFKPALIEQMKLAEKAGLTDLSMYIDNLITSGGKVVEPILTPEKKAQSYKQTLSKFLDMTGSAISDIQYLGEVTNELILQLKKTVEALEAKLSEKETN